MKQMAFFWAVCYNDPADIIAYDLNYGTAYIQPGVVSFPNPLQKSNNFLKCVWYECTSCNGDIQVPPEIHLQFINPSQPYIPIHGWDECNPNPIHLFLQQQFDNGFSFFADVQQFLPSKIEKSAQTKQGTTAPRKSAKDLFQHTQHKKRHLESPAHNLKKLLPTKAKDLENESTKQTPAQIRAHLLPAVEDAVASTDGMPKPSFSWIPVDFGPSAKPRSAREREGLLCTLKQQKVDLHTAPSARNPLSCICILTI